MHRVFAAACALKEAENKRLISAMSNWVIRLNRFLENMNAELERLLVAAAPHLEAVARGVSNMMINERLRETLVATGWVYHHTTPVARIASCWDDTETVQTMLDEYYAQNWRDVRSSIESRIHEFDIGEEAEATFREALKAHEFGLYRCVCRVLFPEIERVLRVETFGHRTGRETYKKMLKSLLQGTTLDDFLPGNWLDLTSFSHLTKTIEKQSDSAFDDGVFGLFTHVSDSDLHRLKDDPVPNRHAALHGYVEYATHQNSLNTIFIAEYVFRVITSLRNDDPESQSSVEVSQDQP